MSESKRFFYVNHCAIGFLASGMRLTREIKVVRLLIPSEGLFEALDLLSFSFLTKRARLNFFLSLLQIGGRLD